MPSSMQSVVVHGHFYQPPREDPWLEVVEAQPSAAPSHDWNERVTLECYRAVVAARVPGAQGRIDTIRNTLHQISFNFGPTLLEWMEGHAPQVYGAILEADRASRRALGGHGNAIAQAYHHTILPLASRRDKITEIRWGILDFRRRFGRDPEGMWLPETAADEETLEVLAQEGISFTILAPHQIHPLPKGGRPGLFSAGGGRTLALFPYDGALSHGVAFGSLLQNAEAWYSAIEERGRRDSEGGDRLVALATDGETYGHHHRFGEMALAALLRRLESNHNWTVENFASFLARNPPVDKVEVVGPSSWSCAHGVERWRSNCGCKMDPSRPTQQRWRTSLRKALEELAVGLHRVFAEEGAPLLGDPWEARDAYGAVASGGPAEASAFVRGLAPEPLDQEGVTRAVELLEMERNALRLFTSCGWFFDDLAGIEPRQVLRYAARAVELAGKGGLELERDLLANLLEAKTNEDPSRTGVALFLEEAKPPFPPHLGVAAGVVALQAGTELTDLPSPPPGDVPGAPGFAVTGWGPDLLTLKHRRTGRERKVRFTILDESDGPLQIRVWPQGEVGRAVTLSPWDLPEAFRVPVERGPRDALLLRWAPQLLPVAEGLEAGGLGPLLNRELHEAVRALDRDQGEEAIGRVIGLAHLHEIVVSPIPFDVQTDFFRILQASSPDERDRLAVLREPLGFVVPR